MRCVHWQENFSNSAFSLTNYWEYSKNIFLLLSTAAADDSLADSCTLQLAEHRHGKGLDIF